MVKRILSVFVSVMLLASLMMPAMGVSANVEVVDITDYTPVMPDSLTYGGLSNGAYGNDAYGIKFENTADTGWKWSSVAQATREEAPSNYMLASIGGVWNMTSGIEAGTTYVLSFNVRNKSPEGIIPNCVYGLWDGSVSGDNEDWIGQYAYAEEVTSTTDWTNISKTFKVDYNSSAATRIRIGLGSGNTHEAYAGRENFDFRPNALLQIDNSTLYIAPEAAYDVINEISMTKALPGATVIGNAKVVNQVGDKGNLDQNITYFVTDTEGNVVEGVSVVAGTNGSYTATVDANATDGDYVITARAAAYNTTENFMQHSVTLTVENVDYSDTDYITTDNLLGTLSEVKFGHTISTSGNIATVTAGAAASATSSIARPAGGLDWKVSTEISNNDVFVATVKVKKANTGNVNPNFIFGMVDETMGGTKFNPTYNFKEQYLNTQDITDDEEWTTVKHYMQIKNVAVDVYNPSLLHFVVGIGAGNTNDSYKNKTAFEFRSGAAMDIDKDSVYLAKETLKGIINEATGSTSVFPGQSISARASVVNNIDDTGSLDQTIEYIVLDSDTRKIMTNDITIAEGADGNYTINVGEDAAAGNYVAVASNTTNGTTIRKGLEFTVETIDKYLTEYETVAVDGKALFDGRSEKSQVTGITITDPSAATEHMYVVTADSSRDDSSAPNVFATPAAGVRLFVANGGMLKDTSYVISFRVKNTSPEGVTPNVVFGFLDKSQGGGNPDWNWLGQYTWAEEITTQGEWTTITKRVTLGYNSGANSYLLIGLGAGNTYTQYNGKENYDFRPNASLTIDPASAFIAPEAFYDISASASKNVVRAGASVLVDAKAVNQIGLEGALAQNFSWAALNSAKSDVAEGITITPVSGDTSKVNVTFDKDVAEGTYVIAAYSEDYDAVRHIPITVSNKTSIENVAVDTVNRTVTFDAVNVADSGLSGAVFVAEYSGDTYVKAEKASFTLSGGDSVDNEVTYTLVPADGNKIIVYIWDYKLTPYVQPIVK